MSRDIAVPRVQDGVLQYAMMELVAPSVAGEDWSIRDKAVRPRPAGPANGAMPGTIGNLSTDPRNIRDKSTRPPPAVPVTSAMPETPGLVSSGHDTKAELKRLSDSSHRLEFSDYL
jgi:hypothetical protein